jgi:hypothetical protein
MEPNQLLYIIKLTEALNNHTEALDRFAESVAMEAETATRMAKHMDRLAAVLINTRDMWDLTKAVN